MSTPRKKPTRLRLTATEAAIALLGNASVDALAPHSLCVVYKDELQELTERARLHERYLRIIERLEEGQRAIVARSQELKNAGRTHPRPRCRNPAA
jgi:cytosine/adenosine deaminase-related metal-dependent hydrolase